MNKPAGSDAFKSSTGAAAKPDSVEVRTAEAVSSTSLSLDDTRALFGFDDEPDSAIEPPKPTQSASQITTLRGSPITPERIKNLSPTRITQTQQPLDELYVPHIPQAFHQADRRQLILDTETTGLEAHNGDRVIEVGMVEMINRKFTGEKFHIYLDPERPMDPEAIRIHGITSDFLKNMPKFEDIAQTLFNFMQGAELIAHNAPFDMGFLNMEFERVGIKGFTSKAKVTDTLALAKGKYAGQKNSLDALVKRLGIITKDRTFHGALLDAEILADVYLNMTGGQVTLSLSDQVASRDHVKLSGISFFVQPANQQEALAHEQTLELLSEHNPDARALWN